MSHNRGNDNTAPTDLDCFYLNGGCDIEIAQTKGVLKKGRSVIFDETLPDKDNVSFIIRNVSYVRPHSHIGDCSTVISALILPLSQELLLGGLLYLFKTCCTFIFYFYINVFLSRINILKANYGVFHF